MNQAERKFALSVFVQGGHGPFRGLDAPFSAESQRNSESRLKSIRGATGCHRKRGIKSVFAEERASHARWKRVACMRTRAPPGRGRQISSRQSPSESDETRDAVHR